MEDEIQLISDGDGLAVIGDPAAVERFLAFEGLASRDLGLSRLGNVLAAGSGAAQVGSEVAANSGRWVKLTKESAELVRKHGLRENGKTGVSTAVLKGPKGQIKGFVEFARSPGSILANPALLAGAAGVMAQLAMQQTMDEITDYLVRIDQKVDDVLRAQKNAVLARMIAVGLSIDEAMAIRVHVGRVNEVTWSKVQAAPSTIADVQSYALLELDRLANKLEDRARTGDLADAAREADTAVAEWLAVLARCFQLQDALMVLEIDRVLAAAPDDLDGHRLGLKAARRERLDLISRSTERLVARMDAAADTANARVLLHPTAPKAVVQAGNNVAGAVGDFQATVGLQRDRQALEARRWVDAATLLRDQAVEAGAHRAAVAARFGGDTLARARSGRGRLAAGVADRGRRPKVGDEAKAPPEN